MACRGHARAATGPARRRANPSFSANPVTVEVMGFSRIFNETTILYLPVSCGILWPFLAFCEKTPTD